MTDEIRSQVDVENEGDRIWRMCEQAYHDIGNRAIEAARAEADYKIAYAKALLQTPDKLTVPVREAIATQNTETLYRERKHAEALLTTAQEASRTFRAGLEWQRSKNANLRPLVSP